MASESGRPWVAWGIAVPLGLLIGIGFAGCSGGAGPTYELTPIRTCLIQADVPVDPAEFDVRTTGPDVGGFRADLGNNEVIVVVEPHAPDAEDTAAAHETFGAGSVERRGNLVLAWDKTPTDAERQTIERCLSG